MIQTPAEFVSKFLATTWRHMGQLRRNALARRSLAALRFLSTVTNQSLIQPRWKACLATHGKRTVSVRFRGCFFKQGQGTTCFAGEASAVLIVPLTAHDKPAASKPASGMRHIGHSSGSRRTVAFTARFVAGSAGDLQSTSSSRFAIRSASTDSSV